MIKLLSLLLPFVVAVADQNVFLFPDQKNDFIHRLMQSLRQSDEHIIVISSSFNQPEIKKAILRQAKKGCRTDLIVQHTDGAPANMVQYDNIELYAFTARPLEGSIILIDNSYACTLSAPLDDASLSRHASFGICTDEPEKISEIHKNLLPLIRRSESYLK